MPSLSHFTEKIYSIDVYNVTRTSFFLKCFRVFFPFKFFGLKFFSAIL